MIISCPNCNLSKDIGDVQISKEGDLATCPKCRTRFKVKPEERDNRPLRRIIYISIFIVVLSSAILAFLHDWKLDKDYFLQPGIWQGDMTYMGERHPFELVIETAQDGRMAGYMDWVGMSPRYRLFIRGTYVGNHLIFEDYAFIERGGLEIDRINRSEISRAAGLNDQQDVYIIGNEMTGTAKNGRADFHALKRESAPF